MQFKYKAYRPTTDDYINLREITTKEYLAIVKTVANKQPDLVQELFDQLLIDLTGTCDYNKLDKFFILCTVRAVCVGSRLSLSFEDKETKKPYKTHIQVMKLLQDLADIEESLSETITLKGVQVTLDIPSNLYIDNPENLLYECVNSIKIGDQTIDTKSISFEDRKQLVESLPIEIVTKIRAFIKNINEHYSNVILYRVMNPHSDDKKVQTYYFNIFDNSMYEFITALLTDNLKGIYELMYVLSRRANISIESLYQHTYAEVRMYLDIYEHELKLEEEARKKEQQKNKSASPQPIGNPIDNFKP